MFLLGEFVIGSFRRMFFVSWLNTVLILVLVWDVFVSAWANDSEKAFEVTRC